LIQKQLDIVQPTLLLNKDRAIRNIKRMAGKAAQSGVGFRPHCKTHQSSQVAAWFRECGAKAIAVPSVAMAEYFSRHGWRDISVTHPVNWREIDRINSLADRINLGLLVESRNTAQFLADHVIGEMDVWIEVDTGDRRTGIDWTRFDTIAEVARLIRLSPHLRFRGILTHAGHSYQAVSQSELIRICQAAVRAMTQVKERLIQAGHTSIRVSFGDTPCCSVLDSFDGVDEIRPGTFVFYDVRQHSLGACAEEDIAAALICPVIAKRERRSELTIYGGAAHLAKDYLSDPVRGRVYGYATTLTDSGWGILDRDCYVSNLSQEVGIVKAGAEFFESTVRGDLLAVLPIHICLCVNLIRTYVTLGGEIISCAPVADAGSIGHAGWGFKPGELNPAGRGM
jgi:D-serine deaminase-like pyridoxal phosphate-dependent protein